jgi:hypothetical protein
MTRHRARSPLVVVLTIALFVLLEFIVPADGAVRVRGYFRKDGTCVRPHYRSYPDGNPYNNWSTYPNINPYTGKQGTKRVYPRYSRSSLGGLDDVSGMWQPSVSWILDPNAIYGNNPISLPSSALGSLSQEQRQNGAERAEYWKERGYNFDPTFMTAYAMDCKVRDIERAKQASGEYLDVPSLISSTLPSPSSGSTPSGPQRPQ